MMSLLKICSLNHYKSLEIGWITTFDPFFLRYILFDFSKISKRKSIFILRVNNKSLFKFIFDKKFMFYPSVDYKWSITPLSTTIIRMNLLWNMVLLLLNYYIMVSLAINWGIEFQQASWSDFWILGYFVIFLKLNSESASLINWDILYMSLS